MVAGEWQNMIGEAASRFIARAARTSARAAAGRRRNRHSDGVAGHERSAGGSVLGRRERAGNPRHLVSRNAGRRRRVELAVRRGLTRREVAIQLAAQPSDQVPIIYSHTRSHEPDNPSSPLLG